jgi:nucleoside-diphosphate-sugar epimerase
MKIVVTGGRGFIGSHFVDLALKSGHTIIDIDNMTYAASEEFALG